jgi:hypothetical protein
MLCTEIIAVGSEIRTKHIKRGQNVEVVMLKLVVHKVKGFKMGYGN